MKRIGLLLFSILIIFEIIIAGILGFRILKKDNIKGASVVIPLFKENFIFGNSENLKYFYEPIPGWIEDDINKRVFWKERYLINSDTLNERYEYAVERPSNVFRIITLGDSFTFGQFVDTVKNYPEQLEDILNTNTQCENIKKFEVINLGVPGYDIQYAVERFKIRGQKYDPDLVLWLLKDDDFFIINEIRRKNRDQYKEEMMESGEWDRRIKEGEYNPISQLLAQDMGKVFNNIGETQVLKMQRSFLEEFNELYKNKIVFFSFPILQKKYKNIIEEYNQKNEKTYFTTVNALLNKDERIQDDPHPSAKGYALIVQDLYKFIREERLIPCI